MDRVRRIRAHTAALATAVPVAATLLWVEAAGAEDVRISPNAGGMPGADMVKRLLNWGGQVALWASVGAFVAGSAMYGWSQWQGRTQGAHRGQTLALGGAVGALLVGVAPAAINMLYRAAGG